MKIERVETFVVSLPERRPHVMASIQQKQGDYVIVRVEAEGLVGYGEATVLKEWGGDHGRYYGEHPSTTLMIIDELLGPAVVGEDALRIETVLDKMDRVIRGYPYAKASRELQWSHFATACAASGELKTSNKRRGCSRRV